METMSLREVVEEGWMGKHLDHYLSPPNDAQSALLLMPGCVQKDAIDFDRAKSVWNRYNSRVMQEGDVILVRRDKVRAGIMTQHSEPVLPSGGIIVLRPKVYPPQILHAFLNLKADRLEAECCPGFRGLSLEDVLKLKIPRMEEKRAVMLGELLKFLAQTADLRRQQATSIEQLAMSVAHEELMQGKPCSKEVIENLGRAFRHD